MSQVPASRPGAADWPGSAGSASTAEKSATSKLRSCVVCRSRKVRCDKLSPCSNCRRANIACILPAADRPPRWARRLERVTQMAPASSSPSAREEAEPRVGQVMDRLHHLESLVKELSGQLEKANAAAARSTGGSSGINSPESSSHDRDRDAEHLRDSPLTIASNSGVQKQLGKLVLHDASKSRYVSSRFWSHVNDEINDLNIDARELADDESDVSTESSPGKTLSTQELERTPSDRHAFLFSHNLNPSNPNLRDFHPLPSQIPFLLNVYSENVHLFFQVVHIPSINKMIRESRGRNFTPANEALLLSIYYAAVTSMEEEEIITNFGCTKPDLTLKYRRGLEHALAKADFLNVPDIVLVQAFAIFLMLVRRHDSPRFVWMMTGLVIRMAKALGLHRDGSHFDYLTPYEVEIRRKVWWAVCMLDLRASEDQGTELTITRDSFDTKLPLNINDTDIEPQKKEIPSERQSVTDMTFTLIWCETYNVMVRLMALAVGQGASTQEDRNQLLNELYEVTHRRYLQYVTETDSIEYWVAITVTRLVIAKMTLLIYLPVLFTSPSEVTSDEIRAKLLVSAIEVAEYNHELNSNKACSQWRWVFQTYTHWYSVVYLLLETSRRPWSFIIERAWVALHSSWLIPVQSKTDKNLRMWIPLRKLMAKARNHREAELERLRDNPRAAAQLEIEVEHIPPPKSSGPFPTGKSNDHFRERWRELVAMPKKAGDKTQTHVTPSTKPVTTLNVTHTNATQQSFDSVRAYGNSNLWTSTGFEPIKHIGQTLSDPNTMLSSTMAINSSAQVRPHQTTDSSYNPLAEFSSDWSENPPIGSNTMPWLWAVPDVSVDAFAGVDVNMDLDTEVDWYNWVESAKGMEWNFGVADNGH
ncbi:fungal-specific transcription factor domain-containing protein [Bisporella sp. PMI_857]|nr:fungal-specific transcription factor domain-containing protein [Bisporella sp. PMI_857]